VRFVFEDRKRKWERWRWRDWKRKIWV